MLDVKPCRRPPTVLRRLRAIEAQDCGTGRGAPSTGAPLPRGWAACDIAWKMLAPRDRRAVFYDGSTC